MDPRKKRIRNVVKLAHRVEPLGPVIHAGLGRGNRVKHPVESGNRSHYLMARIKRDHPDVMQRCLDGEFVSVRQAAIAAGIIKPKPHKKGRGE